jgi:hypothetical protein
MELFLIIKDAFTSVNKVKGVLAKALSFHFIAFILLEAATYAEFTTVVDWLLEAIGLYVYVLIAITTHRVLLLGPDAVPAYGIIGFSMRELRYVMYMIGLFLLSIPVFIFAYIPYVGIAFYLAFYVWLWGRSALVFPGTALNDDFELHNSWAVTKGYNLMMIMVVIVYPIILSIPAIFIEDLPYGSFVNIFIYMITTVLEVSALSMAYKYFVIEPKAMNVELEG